MRSLGKPLNRGMLCLFSFAYASSLMITACWSDQATGSHDATGVWSQLGLSDKTVTAVVHTPWGLFAGTSRSGVYRFEAGDWTALGLDHANVSSMLFVPSDTGRLLVGVSPHAAEQTKAAVFASSDSGATWTVWDGGLAAQYGNRAWAYRLAVDPGDPDRLFWGGVAAVRRSLDGGRSWELVYGGGGVGMGVTRLAISPERNGTVWAVGVSAIGYGFTIRSDDWGSTWRSDDLPAAVLAFSPAIPTRLFMTHGNVVYWSDDGGQTLVTSLTLASKLGTVVSIAFVGDTTYAATWSSQEPLMELYRSLDGGGSWERFGVPDRVAGAVSMTTDPEGRLYIGTDRSGVWRVLP